MIELQGKYGTAMIYADIVEDSVISQVYEFLNSVVAKDTVVKIMPDTHAGASCVIGFTAKLPKEDFKIVPNIVGVDISCGMSYIKLPREINKQEILNLDAAIREDLLVPFGFSVRGKKIDNKVLDRLKNLHVYNKLYDINRIELGLGTLGGGNHFIEIAVSENTGAQYLVVHSGSRNLGKQIAELYTQLALNTYEVDKAKEIAETIEKCKITNNEKSISVLLKQIHEKYRNINKNLAFLEGESAKKYIHDMTITQEYARQNRIAMIKSIFGFLDMSFAEGDMRETVHNYYDVNSHTIRKGAVSAELGEELLIPINMQYGSFICEGLGNEEWNNSAPHGAGRLLARGEAKRTLSMEEYQESMKGILTSSVGEHTLDEAPMAYKDPQDIVNAIAGKTVNVLDRLIPIYNFKG